MVRAEGGQWPLYNVTIESGETLDYWQISVKDSYVLEPYGRLPNGDYGTRVSYRYCHSPTWAQCRTARYISTTYAYSRGQRPGPTEETLAIFHVFVFLRICGFLMRGLRDKPFFRAFGGMGIHGSTTFYLFLLLDGSEVGLRIQCLKERQQLSQQSNILG